jgi:hypothetical protein
MIEVAISNMKWLMNLTLEQMTKIKQDLTISNPAYEKAIRYTNYNYYSIPKYLFYYQQFDGTGLVVPTYYDESAHFKSEVIADSRVEVNVNYP